MLVIFLLLYFSPNRPVILIHFLLLRPDARRGHSIMTYGFNFSLPQLKPHKTHKAQKKKTYVSLCTLCGSKKLIAQSKPVISVHPIPTFVGIGITQ